MKKILISPIGGQAIYGIICYFKKKGYKIIGIDSNSEPIGRYFVDLFLKVPPVNIPEYKECIYKILANNKIDIFISWLDPEIIFWNKIFFSEGFREPFNRVHTFNIRKDIIKLYDKMSFYQMLKKSGFLAPNTVKFYENRNLILKALKFPIVIKPRLSSGSRNIYIARNKYELEFYQYLVKKQFGNFDNFIVQEFIEGKECTVDFFAIDGEIKNMVIRERMEHKGVSLKGQIIYSDKIENILKKFCRCFNMSLLNNIQLIERENEIFILEVNLRPSGTIMLSINAGVDLLNNLIEYKENKQITIYGKPKKLKMIRYYNEFYYE